MSGPLLRVRDLRLRYRGRYGDVDAVRGVSFDIEPGERVALVGESGSGKSTIAGAVLGLSPRSLVIAGGGIAFDGRELLGARDRLLDQVRGRDIGFVPQDPTVSLNPVKRIGDQVAEVLRTHRLCPKPLLRARVLEALADAGLDDPELRASQFPHELSGGLRQRVLIAIGLVSSPRLLVADEPTSALDVTVQKQILDLLDRRVARAGLAELLITHDLGVAADRADRILVLSHGELVEQGPPERVLRAPEHPYTRRLIADAPSLHAIRRVHAGGGVATPAEPVVPAESAAPAGSVAVAVSAPAAGPAVVAEPAPERAVLRLERIVKEFPLPSSLGGGMFRAVDELDLAVGRGRTTGLVGESGSGKTTTGRIALRLEAPTSGRVLLDGEDVADLRGERLRQLRRRIQIVQQNPYAALNPRMTIAQIVEEPLASFGVGDRAARRRRAAELIDQVALPARVLHGRPVELSGGQRQRVAIARALALAPEFLLLDEPVSALDVSVQAQILDLLIDLQREHGLSYLFISHDLAVVRDIAHEVSVIERGRIVEAGDTERVFAHPSSTYTRELLDAIPGAQPVSTP